MFIADYDTERATLKANIAKMEKVQDTKADMGRCRKGKEKRITIYYKFIGPFNKAKTASPMDAEKNHLALRLFVISSSRLNLSYNGVILVFVIASASLHEICSK